MVIMAEVKTIDFDCHTNESERLIKGLAEDYASLLIPNDPKEKLQLNETVEEVLMKLDEFARLADAIRIDNNFTLNSTLTKIHAKSKVIQKHFERIDRLEAYVAMVKENLTEVEAVVNKAESELVHSSLKRAISSIPFFSALSSTQKSPTSKSSTSPKPCFEPFQIFSTKEFFRSVAVKEAELAAEELELLIQDSELSRESEISLENEISMDTEITAENPIPTEHIKNEISADSADIWQTPEETFVPPNED